jgi:hypothetical protein
MIPSNTVWDINLEHVIPSNVCRIDGCRDITGLVPNADRLFGVCALCTLAVSNGLYSYSTVSPPFLQFFFLHKQILYSQSSIVMLLVA